MTADPLPHGMRPVTFWRRTRNIARRALRLELRIYESLWRVVSRRTKLPDRARGFRYHRPVTTILFIFIVLSAVEIPIIDAIVHRWLPIRIAFLALGIWGLTWMIGLYCAYLTRPHSVGPGGVGIREGLELDINIDWADITAILPHKTAVDPSDPDRPKGRLTYEEGERICAVRIAHETNLELVLTGPTGIRLPGLPPKGGAQQVTRIRFWADDPDGLLAAARDYRG